MEVIWIRSSDMSKLVSASGPERVSVNEVIDDRDGRACDSPLWLPSSSLAISLQTNLRPHLQLPSHHPNPQSSQGDSCKYHRLHWPSIGRPFTASFLHFIELLLVRWWPSSEPHSARFLCDLCFKSSTGSLQISSTNILSPAFNQSTNQPSNPLDQHNASLSKADGVSRSREY